MREVPPDDLIAAAEGVFGEVTATIKTIANGRHELHQDHDSSRPLSEGYENVGMFGEFAFGEMCGMMPDISDKPKGDGGVDFEVPLRFTVDVKTARKAYNLIHEKGKPFADIYVLAKFDDETQRATLLGWEWGSKLKKAPTKDFGHGIVNHYIPKDDLRPMADLAERIMKIA